MSESSSPALPPASAMLASAPRRSWVARARRAESTHDADFPDTVQLLAVDYLGYEPPAPESFAGLPSLEELVARKRALARPDSRLLPDIDLTLDAPWPAHKPAKTQSWSLPKLLPDRAQAGPHTGLNTSTLEASGDTGGMDSDLPSIFLSDPLPAAASRVPSASRRPRFQWVAYSVLGLAASTVMGVAGWHLASSGWLTKLPCLGDVSECFARIAANSPRVASVTAAASTPALPRPDEPHLPCKFVGYWTYEAEGTTRKVVLQDDGSYLLNPEAVLTGREFTGRWTVEGDRFVWRHDQVKSDVPDINPIAEEGPEHFVLIEMNGDRTRFNRVASLPTTRCVR